MFSERVLKECQNAIKEHVMFFSFTFPNDSNLPSGGC